jgi:hypothetical protein
MPPYGVRSRRSGRLVHRLLAAHRRRLTRHLRQRAEWARQARDAPRLEELMDAEAD